MMDCSETGCTGRCNQGRLCASSDRATRSMLASPGFWVGGALSLVCWAWLLWAVLA